MTRQRANLCGSHEMKDRQSFIRGSIQPDPVQDRHSGAVRKIQARSLGRRFPCRNNSRRRNRRNRGKPRCGDFDRRSRIRQLVRRRQRPDATAAREKHSRGRGGIGPQTARALRRLRILCRPLAAGGRRRSRNDAATRNRRRHRRGAGHGQEQNRSQNCATAAHAYDFTPANSPGQVSFIDPRHSNDRFRVVDQRLQRAGWVSRRAVPFYSAPAADVLSHFAP